MTLYHSTGIIAASGGAAAKPGMVLLTPTSIAHSGTSASIGTNGQVTFTAVTSLSLNGCFTADFDNYVIAIECTGSGSMNIDCRLRAAGSDASGSNYTRQYLYVDNTTVTAARLTSQTVATIGYTHTGIRSGNTTYVYGPFLAQPTAFRVLGMGGTSLFINDDANTHSLSTSYDGFTAIPTANNMTGKLAVYGIRG